MIDITGELLSPNEREHLFKNMPACLDFVLAFNIRNFNVREGWNEKGTPIVQLVYQVVNN